jgi:hypothetical protein
VPGELPRSFRDMCPGNYVRAHVMITMHAKRTPNTNRYLPLIGYMRGYPGFPRLRLKHD